MRTALISDIHGNFDGLQATLADITAQQCDRVICLGDLVDGGTQSVEVVRFMREQGMRQCRVTTINMQFGITVCRTMCALI